MPSLLTRLRRHRGLWVLAVAVLLIKLVSGSICVADGAGMRFASATAAAPTTLVADTAVSPTAADDANSCLLGEGSGCHCACAHSVTLPASAPLPIARMEAHFAPLTFHSGVTPATTGSLLRPPIA
ncbi:MULTISPECIES: hypothetical protein [Rhodanobacter]|uniref:hypothetical protein n=1 Tax=Rhodanobacter TaxID=75309 RepID=UPI001E3266B0|nr:MULTISPECIES: hypothetical protein [Rhodanobacter]UJJ53493.1 hypothetical protein LRK53_10880 [Rhodanobacter thiooxydans]UJJ56814.1 hypothetical protein LRK53_18545 [Rhodanobacter thiooxydans]UJM95553.1 hypothetical protein LRK32_09065 [Rhodanobacter denitrificans]UJM99084.1 hypothetical protein LRK44_09070 [Rhodanobacter denitrificans]UJN21501.1 hypothetical protein LRK54_17570 [Rhodanobacter denitrificans]